MTPEQRAARIHHHEYSGEGIREHAERIVALEELVRDMLLDDVEQYWHEFADRARELGIEVSI